MKTSIKKNSGYSLVELVVVLAIAGILAAIGVPQYSLFVAKNNVKKAGTDLLQNMRLARTMAIKENRAYLVTFNEVGSNNYRVGFDGDNNNSLSDAVDGYESGPIRQTNLATVYGDNIVLGSSNFTTTVPKGPEGTDIENASLFRFFPDGSVSFPSNAGTVYLQHSGKYRGYTYCVEIADASGTVNLHMWQGDADHPTITLWTEVR